MRRSQTQATGIRQGSVLPGLLECVWVAVCAVARGLAIPAGCWLLGCLTVWAVRGGPDGAPVPAAYTLVAGGALAASWLVAAGIGLLWGVAQRVALAERLATALEDLDDARDESDPAFQDQIREALLSPVTRALTKGQ